MLVKRLPWILTLCLVIVFAGSLPSTANTYYTLETPNFLIHFPLEYLDYAKQVGTVAQWAHDQLYPAFRYTPEERTHITVFDRGDLANGFADSILYNMIGLYPIDQVGYGYRSGMSANGSDWLSLLVLHEYAHILHLDLNTGLARNLRSIFGRIPGAGNPHIMQSYALIEGIALWQETNKTGGGRGTAGFYDMFLQGILADQKFLSGDQVLGRYSLSGWHPGTAYYFYGYYLVDYLINQYGEDSFYRLLDYLAQQPTSLDNGLNEIYYQGFNQIWDDMVYTLQAKQTSKKQTTQAWEYLNTHGEIQRHPVFSPDGNHLVYFASGNTTPALRMYSWSTGEDQQLVQGRFSDESQVSWLDNQRIVYGKLELDRFGYSRYDLYEYNLATKQETRLSFGKRIYAVTALDSESLVYLQRTTEDTVIGVKQDGAFQTIEGHPGDRLANITAASNGTLAISVTEASGYRNLYLLTIHGAHSIRTPITQDTKSQGNPVFSTDNRYLFFDGDYTGVFNIYAWDIQTNQFYQVTNSRFGSFAPAVTIDGQWLVVMDYTPDGYKLAKAKLDSREWTAVQLPFVSLPVASKPELFQGEIVPYNSLSSMRPRFWLPVLEAEPQFVTGVYTAGRDALDQHDYSAMIGYGWDTHTLAVKLNYQHKVRAPFRPTLTVSFTQATHMHDQGFRQQQNFDLMSLITKQTYFSALQFGMGLTGVRQVTKPLSTTKLAGKLRITYQDYQGAGTHYHQRSGVLTYLQELNTAKRYQTGVLAWKEAWGELGSGKLTMQTTIGHSSDPNGFVVGGLDGVYAVRGYGREERTDAYILSFDFEYPVLKIERGWADFPIFLQEFQLNAFMDFTDGWSQNRWQSAGFEFGPNISLHYGNATFYPRIGVVKTIHNEKWQWYLRTGMGSIYF